MMLLHMMNTIQGFKNIRKWYFPLNFNSIMEFNTLIDLFVFLMYISYLCFISLYFVCLHILHFIYDKSFFFMSILQFKDSFKNRYQSHLIIIYYLDGSLCECSLTIVLLNVQTKMSSVIPSQRLAIVLLNMLYLKIGKSVSSIFTFL